MEQFIKYVLGEIRVIAGAPLSFAVAIFVVGGAIWWLLDWKYAAIISQRDGVISNKDAELSLIKGQRDEYKDKLSGATPDQAKARIDALEARLAAVEPRRLNTEQRAALIARLSLPPGTVPTIAIAAEATSDSPQLAADLAATFKSAGSWNVIEATVMGIGNRPPSGIGINLPDPNNPPMEATIIMNAFRVAKIAFDLRQAPLRPGTVVEILICSRISR